ncbi:MAG: hypothetical protein WA610_07695 [Thermodesulfovibrionales bacterium]
MAQDKEKKKLKMKPHTGKDVMDAMNKTVKKVINMKPYKAEELLKLKPYTPKDVVAERNEAIKKLNKKLGSRMSLWNPVANEEA